MKTLMPRSSVFLALTLPLLLFSVDVVGRQMCYTCQYVLNGHGIECVTAPMNWTGGEPRMKCPQRCTILAEYDAKTCRPTFFFRGCAAPAAGQEDGCHENGARHSCIYSCGDGDHYCNDQSIARSPNCKGKSKAGDGNGGGAVEKSSLALLGIVQFLVFVIRKINFRR